MLVSVFDREENIVGKGENAGYPHFLFFPQYFQKTSSFGLLIDCFLKVTKTLWKK